MNSGAQARRVELTSDEQYEKSALILPCSCSSNPFPTPADSTVERSNKCLILKVDHAIQFWASVLFHEMQKGTNSPSSDSSMGCHSQCLPSTLKVVGAAFSPTLRVLQPLSLGATLRWATTRRAFQGCVVVVVVDVRRTDGSALRWAGRRLSLSLSEFGKWRAAMRGALVGLHVTLLW